MTRSKPPKADIVAVARRANVSISTVSRSFNHPDLVKGSTRERIDAAVRELGYIRNRAAQAIHGRSSGTVGLLVPTIDHTIFAEVIQAFSDALDAQGFTMLIATHGYDLDREYAMLRKMIEHRVDGVALVGLAHSPESLELIAQQDVPAISVWNYDADAPMACVGADNSEAGRMAAGHLAGLGHRRIGLIFPDTVNNDRARARLDGAVAALAEAGIDVPPDLRREAPYSLGAAKAAAAELLALPDRPTALLCGNDVIAQGAVYAARAAGIAVPGQLSVMGIGDFRGSAEMEPALSTVRIPAQLIGQLAGERIIALVAAPDSPIDRTRLDLRLLARDTTGPVAA